MNEQLQNTITQVSNSFEYTVNRRVPGRGRYEYAILTKEEKRFFMKAGFNQQEDYDEPILLHNIQREVWWAKTIAALEKTQTLPFTSPHLLHTNISYNDTANEEIGWIIFDYEEGEPLSGGSIWDTGQVDKSWQSEQVKRFNSLIPNLCASLNALHNITPATVSSLNITAKPPHKPHGETMVPDEFTKVIKQQNLLDPELLQRALSHPKPQHLPEVLGQGDFEVGHLMIREDGTVVISDNEFAGWYPKYDSLTYCLHRLWATRQQPELAKLLLGYFIDRYVTQNEREQFWTDFSSVMIPRLVRGIYYDATRRTIPTGHKNQQLRHELLRSILDQDFKMLT